MNFELKKIDLFSAIKISFCINAVIGIFVGLLMGLFMALMFGLIDQFAQTGRSFDPPPFGMFGGFFIGVIYALILIVVNGIIVPCIAVLLYNLFAGWLGGMKFYFKEIPSGVAAQPITAQALTTPPPDTTGGNV
jgi:predicted membrane-bound spermidine synthase